MGTPTPVGIPRCYGSTRKTEGRGQQRWAPPTAGGTQTGQRDPAVRRAREDAGLQAQQRGLHQQSLSRRATPQFPIAVDWGVGGGGLGVGGGVRPNTQTSRLLKVRASERVQSRSPGEVAVLHKGSPPNAPTPSQTPPSLRPSPPACAPCATTAFCLSIMTPSCRRFSDRTVCVEEWAVGVPGLQRARGPEAPKHPVATVLLKGRWGGGAGMHQKGRDLHLRGGPRGG